MKKLPPLQSQNEQDWGKRKSARLTEIERSEKKDGKKNFKIVLARMKKDSHLCSPETDGLETRGTTP